ncbi:hypothetical protein K505DRAFT_359715 [Melanomma pulvis-pyrius CBS 109.77]|uniref:Uncharacterized protein n=1 Tax=Melanomma pulvis-pyrius CBS 109.77 TaxID=1314802 RepID=A0A6A6XHT7_9PLEO|nr:hypothetical protein K505DRAFT_359715 [Melanomma pulvis-pyrius CBS 109.77]
MRSQPSLYWLLPLSILLLNSLPSSTVSAELAVRGGCCPGGTVDDDGNCAANPSDVADEATDDNSAGIGFELETTKIRLEPENRAGCTNGQLEKAKGHVIGGRTGINWELTGDTTISDFVDAEYILNGKTIKLGSGDLRTAAEEVANDITAWNPYAGMTPNSFEIDQNECNNWKVVLPVISGVATAVSFSPQATAPMPFESHSRTVSKSYNERTFDFFQASPSPGGLALDSLKDDTLGFFSLVMSYAKVDKKAPNMDGSVKEATSIMPRNDFSLIYKLLKDSGAMPSIQGSLWDLINTLSCYKNDPNDGNNIVFDTEFCDGDVKTPKPKDGKLEGMTYHRGEGEEVDGCTMKEWIDAIEAGTTPDPITRVDQKEDGSVGRLGGKFENVLNTNRLVPIFEFRRLESTPPSGFGFLVQGVEDAIVAYHGQFANAPRLLRKKQNVKYSHIKRDAPTDACAAPTPTTAQGTDALPPTTPAPNMPSCSLQNEDPDKGIDARGCVCGSTTLPLMTMPDATDDSQSCSYTAIPTSSIANPITIESQTYTDNCYLCTLVGGVADTPSCATTLVSGCTPTTPAVPTATVFISNNSIPIGDENNKNGGADLRNSLFQQLQKLCPDNENVCDSKTPAEFDNVETVVGDEPGEETLKFIIQDSHYDSTKECDQMIAAAVASWQQAVAKSCKEVEYEDYEDPTASGCGDGVVKRALMTLEERKNTPKTPVPICDNCSPPPPPECKYTATICAGPDHINPILGNVRNGPYANHMNIQLEFELGHGNSAFDEFICELIVDGLTALAMAVAPELAGVDAWEDIELQALCAELAEHIGSRDANVTKNALLIGA